MEKTQEVEVVKTAYFLEDRIAKLEKEKRQLANNKPQAPTPPLEPQEKFLKAKIVPYPEINPPEVQLPPFWKRGVIILGLTLVATMLSFIPVIGRVFSIVSLFGFWPGVVLLIIDYINTKKEKKRITQENIEKIKNSPEYQRKCQEIDKQNEAEQAKLDKENHEKYVKRYEEYKAACQEYEEKDLKEYNEQIFPAWSNEMTNLSNLIEQTREVLQEVYDKKIIPIQYCNKSALCYLTMFLCTSNFDLKYAIERYDAEVAKIMQREQIDIAKAQLQIGAETLKSQQYANWLNEQIVELSEDGNKTLNSIDNWQNADIAVREYRRYKSRKAAK